jgi:hypothetical protein
MEIDRRTFLALLGASVAPSTAFGGPPPPQSGGGTVADGPLFLGARIARGAYEVAVIDERGRDRLVLPVEARGHSFAVDAPRRRAVAFARAPGRHAVAFDVDGKGEPMAIATAPGRHFFGHGIFTPDGRLMLASESDYEAGEGVTGLYDASGCFRRVGEFRTSGIGPHEIVLMGDGKTVCVANGGILTHPDYERLKLNLDTMKPNLAYLDVVSGAVVEQVELAPELHQLSIRHMTLDAAGAIWFSCQWEGDPADRPPLVGRHIRGRQPELFPGPEATLRAMENYVGSMAIDASGTIVATSSPMGGIVVFWDTATGRCLGQQQIADGCGVAPLTEGHVLATSGRGAIEDMTPAVADPIVAGGKSVPAWDNHLRRIG